MSFDKIKKTILVNTTKSPVYLGFYALMKTKKPYLCKAFAPPLGLEPRTL